MAKVTVDIKKKTDVKKQIGEDSDKINIKVNALQSITWMTGSNGRFLLPTLKYTGYKLIPTGKLLTEMGIAPLGGELNNGITLSGVNQTGLSGVAPDVRTFSIAWDYAKFRSKTSLDEYEKLIKNFISNALERLESSITTRSYFDFQDAEEVNKLYLLILQLKQLNESAYEKEFQARVEKMIVFFKQDELWMTLKEGQKIRDALSLAPIITIDGIGDEDTIPYDTLAKIQTVFKEKGYKVNELDEIVEYRSITVTPEMFKSVFKAKTYPNLITNFTNKKIASEIMLARVFYPNIHIELPNYTQHLKVFLIKYLDYFNLVRKKLSVDLKPKFVFSEADKKSMEEASFPLILATTKKLNTKGASHEVVCLDELKLGEELDVIITDKAHELALNRYLSDAGLNRKVQVYTNEELLNVLKRPQSKSISNSVTLTQKRTSSILDGKTAADVTTSQSLAVGTSSNSTPTFLCFSANSQMTASAIASTTQTAPKIQTGEDVLVTGDNNFGLKKDRINRLNRS